VIGGYTLGAADILRRAMGKKKKAEMDKQWDLFSTGMKDNGYSAEATQAVWDVLLPFSAYGFNKSHTAGYGLVSYWTAYLKANYPTEFMAAQLTSIGDNKDKSAIYLAECRRMGIKVLPPDVNDSGLYFAAVGDDIRFGLGAIRNVGANVVQSIVTTRDQKGRFTSFADFLEKVELVCCNKRTIESLIKAGSFDSFGHTRLSLVQVHEEAVDAVTGLKRQEALGQFDLFGFNTGASVASDTSPLAHLVLRPEEWPSKELLRYEREMLGLYVSAHPLDGAERILRKHAPKSIAVVLDEAPKDAEIVVSGMIAAVDRRVNKQGEPWAIVTVEDLDASIEVLFFAKAYSILHENLVADTAVAIKGRVNWREDKMSVFGLEVIQLDVGSAEHNAAATLPFVLHADAVKLDQDVARELRNTLAAHRGTTPVQLVLCNNGRKTALALSEYPVTVGSSLLGELKAISGITVA